MRRTLRTIVLTVAALATGLVAAAPAAAAGPPPYKVAYYEWLTCPAGTATTASITYARTHVVTEDQDVYWLELQGTLTTCRPAGARHAFALAGYRGTSAYGGAVGYPSGTSLTRDYWNFLRIHPDVQAACVIAAETTRLACVSVDWVTLAGNLVPVLGDPLPVDSPLVDLPAITSLQVEINGPVPPSCVKCP